MIYMCYLVLKNSEYSIDLNNITYARTPVKCYCASIKKASYFKQTIRMI